MEKTCTHQPTRHRIYACDAKLSPDTSLSNADCGLTPIANLTFESMLVGALSLTISVKLHTHINLLQSANCLCRLAGWCVCPNRLVCVYCVALKQDIFILYCNIFTVQFKICFDHSFLFEVDPVYPSYQVNGN